MNIVYVARQLHFDGYKLGGRSLVRHLASEHDVTVCGAIVPPDSSLLDGHLRGQVLSSDVLAGIDIVYLEGGLHVDGSDPAKFPLELADEFVRSGGQLVVADVSRAAVDRQTRGLEDANGLLRARPRTSNEFGVTGIRYFHEEAVREQNNALRFYPSQMRLTDWLEPAMEGIDSILTWGAIDLIPGEGIAASAHFTSNVLASDTFVDSGWPGPWAAVNEHGLGHVALIGADVSYDYLVDACPDNARWITNLIALLAGRSQEKTGWTARSAHPPAGGSDDRLGKLLAEAESQQLERKSSFLVPTDPDRPDAASFDPRFAVGKSIAALANTDGGHVIIGQDDALAVIGLASDFERVRGKDRDGFEQKLVEYVDKVMHPRWEVLGLRVHWRVVDDAEVAIIEVPRSAEVVHMTTTKREEAVYVRRGTRSDDLSGRDLVAWLSSRLRA